MPNDVQPAREPIIQPGGLKRLLFVAAFITASSWAYHLIFDWLQRR